MLRWQRGASIFQIRTSGPAIQQRPAADSVAIPQGHEGSAAFWAGCRTVVQRFACGAIALQYRHGSAVGRTGVADE